MAKKILLVDDDELVLIAVAELLRSQGYSVSTAASGERALDLAGLERFDLCVLDTVMPGVTGAELVKRLRSMEHYGRLPIILLISKGLSGDSQFDADLRTEFHLAKPISPDRLIAMIESALL